MEDLNGLAIGLIGLVVGFASNYFIARFNAQNELKRSIAEKRAEAYLSLWPLCRINNLTTQARRNERLQKLRDWYSHGGGLFLMFTATDRFVGALNLLEESKNSRTSVEDLAQIKENLSWLRTEMKFEIGAYTRKEADMTLPNIKLKQEKEEKEEKEKEQQQKEKEEKA